MIAIAKIGMSSYFTSFYYITKLKIMSKENFEAMQAAIEAIPASETKAPNMPVDKFIQEAADLNVWSTNDQAKLLAVGISQAFFDELSVREGALRHAQSLWMKQRYTKEEATRQWNEEAPQADTLRNELEHTFRFAFRTRPDLLERVRAIEDGTGHADMLQDLSDLSVLGKAHLPLLQAIGFDETKLDTAATLSTSLSLILASMNGERTDPNQAKIVRDQAYTHLKEVVDEIRAAGKFVFWKDASRLKGYKSRYFSNR